MNVFQFILNGCGQIYELNMPEWMYLPQTMVECSKWTQFHSTRPPFYLASWTFNYRKKQNQQNGLCPEKVILHFCAFAYAYPRT